MSEQVENANPEQEEGASQTFEQGSEDAAINALTKRATEPEDATETPTDEPEDETTEEPDEGEPEEDEPKEELVEVEYEGKTYTVPPELQKAVLRQADYSRKMAEVQAKDKETTQRIETADKLIEGAEKLAESLAEVRALDAQIASLNDTDWDTLESEDPGRASVLAVKLLRLQQAREKAVNGAQAVSQQIAEAKARSIEAAREAMVKTLVKDLPGWGEELGTKITQYALSKGYTAADLQSLTDPRIVIALDKARKFDAIQSGKQAVQAKAKNAPPVVKPGAKRPATNRAADAMSRLAKSKSSEDAEAAFLARMR